MKLFARAIEYGEALNLQRSFNKLQIDLRMAYNSENFKKNYKVAKKIIEKIEQDDLENMSNKGARDYALSLYQHGRKSVDRNLAEGTLYLFFGILILTRMNGHDIARSLAYRIVKEFEFLDDIEKKFNADHIGQDD